MAHRFHRFSLSITIVAVLLLIASCTHAPKLYDQEGNKLDLAINRAEWVTINGTRQRIYLAGTRKDNPILLWLDGGPGGSELAWVRTYLGALHEHFTIVCWDQRGTAASYRAGKQGLAVEDFTEDVIALSEYLAQTFGQKKIFLLGHSWGGFLGSLAAQTRPDLYHALIAAHPHVNSTENDTIGYHMILEGAKARGDEKTVEKLLSIGEPPYEYVDDEGILRGDGEAYYAVLSRLYSYSPSAPSDSNFRSEKLFLAPQHTLINRINLVRGVIQGVQEVYPKIRHRSLEDEALAFDIPLVVINANYDYSCVAAITERWFSKTSAPSKHYLWLKNSGHNGIYTEAEAFIDFMRDEVLPLET
ncbi:MAG: alpha/beta hydrolase [Spirochaetales bacterium]|nr:alpha/beta hydrolase [Spirochaetales bacterium]